MPESNFMSEGTRAGWSLHGGREMRARKKFSFIDPGYCTVPASKNQGLT